MIEKCVLDVGPSEDLGDELLDQPGIRVLVADPFYGIAETTAKILNLSGFSALSACSVEQAVKIASENAIDVAFIELLIGETNALDAAERILALRPHCRIIIWTGRCEPVLSWVHREADRLFGGCELLCKPVHPPDAIQIARGKPSAYEPSVAGEDCLSGSQLQEYLSEAREVMLEVMSEKGERGFFRG